MKIYVNRVTMNMPIKMIKLNKILLVSAYHRIIFYNQQERERKIKGKLFINTNHMIKYKIIKILINNQKIDRKYHKNLRKFQITY